MNIRKSNSNIALTIFVLSFAVSLMGPITALAATAPSLGSLSPYAIVSSTFTNSNTPPQTIINGDRCDSTPPTTPPVTTTGTITTGGCNPTTGTDQSAALNNVVDGLNVQACTSISGTLNAVIIGSNAAGTFPPGCYAVTGAMDITSGTTVTLDATAPGGTGSVWIFKSTGALTTGASTAGFPSVVLANGADANNVFWAPAAATSLGANFALSATPTFVGNILDAAGISIGHFTNLLGRALAYGGTVLTDANTITVPPTTATLNVIKHVINNNGGTSTAGAWTLTVTSSNGGTGTGSAAGVESPGTAYTLQSGKAYSVAESGGPSGYSSSLSSNCTIASAVANTTYTCTITNDDIAPQLTVTKTVVNDDNGVKVISDFPLFIDGISVTSGVASTTSAGLHTVSETTDSGYTAVIGGDCAANGTITLALGSTKTCTITNNDIAPAAVITHTSGGSSSTGTINVAKIVINDSGGTKTIADFPLFINGTRVISGETNSFPAYSDTYSITETGNSQYTRTFSGDCDANGQIILSPGDNKLCVVTNDDIGAPVAGAPPIIDLVKIPSPLALPNGSGLVTYTYTLRNIGTVPATNISMVGDTCSPITLISGDSNNDSKLDLNETWTYRCSMTLSATRTNTVVATGWANGLSAIDIANATVIVGKSVVPPLIHVTKVPNPLTLPSGEGMVTYTNKVTNPGTVALSNVTLTDDKCGPTKYVSGDTNSNSKLDTTETWTYTCSTKLAKTTTNTAMASGQANGLIAKDFAIVTVIVSSTAPKLPSTGVAPDEKNVPWNVIILVGILMLVSTSIIVALKKSKNS